jgi:hypothetical protein
VHLSVQRTRTLTGIVQSVHPLGHGIIQADDGSKLPFIPIDVLARRCVLAVGQRVVFSIRVVQDHCIRGKHCVPDGANGNAYPPFAIAASSHTPNKVVGAAVMAKWMLICPHYSHRFEHSIILTRRR